MNHIPVLSTTLISNNSTFMNGVSSEWHENHFVFHIKLEYLSAWN